MGTRLKDTAIGDWFATAPEGDCFEIVAMDNKEASLAVQYYDGTVEEIDFANWPQLEAESIDPPEDWAGAFDAGREDLGDEPPPMLSMSDVVDNLDRLLY